MGECNFIHIPYIFIEINTWNLEKILSIHPRIIRVDFLKYDNYFPSLTASLAANIVLILAMEISSWFSRGYAVKENSILGILPSSFIWEEASYLSFFWFEGAPGPLGILLSSFESILLYTFLKSLPPLLTRRPISSSYFSYRKGSVETLRNPNMK